MRRLSVVGEALLARMEHKLASRPLRLSTHNGRKCVLLVSGVGSGLTGALCVPPDVLKTRNFAGCGVRSGRKGLDAARLERLPRDVT